MELKDLVELYAWIRKNNSHTPDDIVDFMYHAAKEKLEKEKRELYFIDHYRLFRKETAFMSFTVRDNEHYKKIIKMGKKAIPIIFTMLRIEPSFDLMDMFECIARAENMKVNIKIPEKKRGKLKEVTEIYLKWANENGY